MTTTAVFANACRRPSKATPFVRAPCVLIAEGTPSNARSSRPARRVPPAGSNPAPPPSYLFSARGVALGHLRTRAGDLVAQVLRRQDFNGFAPTEDPWCDLDRPRHGHRHLQRAFRAVAQSLRWMPDRFLDAGGRRRIEAQANLDWLARVKDAPGAGQILVDIEARRDLIGVGHRLRAGNAHQLEGPHLAQSPVARDHVAAVSD